MTAWSRLQAAWFESRRSLEDAREDVRAAEQAGFDALPGRKAIAELEAQIARLEQALLALRPTAVRVVYVDASTGAETIAGEFPLPAADA